MSPSHQFPELHIFIFNFLLDKPTGAPTSPAYLKMCLIISPGYFLSDFLSVVLNSSFGKGRWCCFKSEMESQSCRDIFKPTPYYIICARIPRGQVSDVSVTWKNLAGDRVQPSLPPPSHTLSWERPCEACRYPHSFFLVCSLHRRSECLRQSWRNRFPSYIRKGKRTRG